MLESFSDLLPYDPEPERTLRKRLRENRNQSETMGDENKTLRDLWIPANQGNPKDCKKINIVFIKGNKVFWIGGTFDP